MQCLQPIRVKGQLMPCGRCPNCMRNKQNSWVFRLNEELKISPYTYFFTLTYRDADLNYACYVSEKRVFPCLSKRDLQLFLKRLRKNTKVKFKYHICGEYGPTTLRPHYHGLLFCQQPLHADDVLSAWNHQDLLGKCFEACWSRSAVGYVSKYLCKTPFLPDYIRLSEKCYRPFTLSSKGLGLSFLECNSQLVNKKISQLEDFVVLDGQKLPMPKYYRDKLFPVGTDIHDDMKLKRLDISMKKKEDLFVAFCYKNNLDPFSKDSESKYELFLSMNRRDAWRKVYKKHQEKIKDKL